MKSTPYKEMALSFISSQSRVDCSRPSSSTNREVHSLGKPTLQSLMRRENFTSSAHSDSSAHPTVSYRSSLNLKWKSHQFTKEEGDSASGDARLSKKNETGEQFSQLASHGRQRRENGGGGSSVFWRECKTESLVRREAIFFNYLLTKSAQNTGSDGAAIQGAAAVIPTSSVVSSVASLPSRDDDDVVAMPQVDQPSAFALMWDVSRVAATSHLLGGDGSFFLRKEFMSEGGGSFVLPSNSERTDAANGAPPISVRYLLKLFGNERTYQLSGIEAERSRLHKASSFLLTESYDCTLADYLKAHTTLDAVQLVSWCRQIAFQISEMHRAGVIHSNIHTDTIALSKPKRKDEPQDAQSNNSAPSRRLSDAVPRAPATSDDEQQAVGARNVAEELVDSTNSTSSHQLTTIKISWLYCATMTDLQVVQGLRKQTLSQSRSDPSASEYHVLHTNTLPEHITTLAKTYSAVLPPEWFAAKSSSASPTTQSPVANSPATNDQQASPSAAVTHKLKSVVVPTEKSDAYLFGKFMQHLFTNTMVEFNPQSVISVSSYYLSKTAQALFHECPSRFGKLNRIDEINAESLRHLITAATMDDVQCRWTVGELFCHPFFWTTEAILEFFAVVIEFAFPVPTEGSSRKHGQDLLTPDGKISLRATFKEASLKNLPQTTKKSNITAPELARLKGISKQLSSWVVETRAWMTPELEPWFEAISLEGRDHDVRTSYENLVHQQIEFLLNTYRYLKSGRQLKVICGGNAEVFFQTFVHRMFPTLLFETFAMVFNEEDGPKFSRFLLSKIRLLAVAKHRVQSHFSPRAELAEHYKQFLTVAERLCQEKMRSIHMAGYDHIVQYVGAFPQYPVHIAESDKVQVTKKPPKQKEKASLSHLPKWAQLQLAAAEL